MDFVRSNRNALWLVPIVLGVGSCVCSFSPMLYFWGTVVIPIDAEHMPLGDTVALATELSENLTTWQILYTLSMYCIPLMLMASVAVASFALVRGVQNRNKSAQQSPPPNTAS
jgi:hypothetical protein